TSLSGQAKTSINDGGLKITGDDSLYGDQFETASISLEKNTDYLISLSIKSLQRGMAAKITSTDRRMVIASEILPESDKASTESQESTATIPFASGDRTEVRLVAANNGVGGPEIIIGKATMIKLGATPYLWTRYPRAAVRVLQKNLYTTKMMLTL